MMENDPFRTSLSEIMACVEQSINLVCGMTLTPEGAEALDDFIGKITDEIRDSIEELQRVSPALESSPESTIEKITGLLFKKEPS